MTSSVAEVEEEEIYRPSLARILLCVVGLLVFAWLVWATRTANHDVIFIPSAPDQPAQTYFVDADCYSRMTRVESVMEHPRVLKQHSFENAPVGTKPHTTVLLDYLIAVPGWMVGANAAGAWLPPVLALLGGLFLAFWAWRSRLEMGGAFWMLAVYALCPMITQASPLGRPDHQALLMLFLAVALVGELAQLRVASRAWAIAAGVAWGLAFWTSLYEPVVFLLASALLIVIVGRSTWRWNTRGWELGVFAGIFLLSIVIEGGLRINLPGAGGEDAAYFKNWALTISEMQPLGLNIIQALPLWLGWSAFAAPLLLGLTIWKTRGSAAIYISVLLALTFFLTMAQQRWVFYFCLVFALSLPWQLAWLEGKLRWWLHGALAIFLVLPLAGVWDSTVFLEGAEKARVEEGQLDSVLARQIAETIRQARLADEMPPPAETLLAPWWITPSLVYWSGAPGVAGSSHQSLPGIVDSARFFAAVDWEAGARLLHKRRVRWVVAYEPQRVLGVSQAILAEDMPKCGPGQMPLASTLYDRPGEGPNYLQLVGRNQFYVLYQVRPAVLERWVNETAAAPQP